MLSIAGGCVVFGLALLGVVVAIKWSARVDDRVSEALRTKQCKCADCRREGF